MPTSKGNTGAKKFLPGIGKLFTIQEDEMGDFYTVLTNALSGQLVLSITPATVGNSAAAVTTAIAGAGFSRNVTIALVDASSNIHTWFDGTFAITIADTATGAAAIRGGASVATFVNGVALITIDYTGTWASTNTSTFTITGGTKLGFTVADKTSVDTLIA
jgi:hypothetical protein